MYRQLRDGMGAIEETAPVKLTGPRFSRRMEMDEDSILNNIAQNAAQNARAQGREDVALAFLRNVVDFPR
jgi:hypothetical protein